MFRKSVIPPTSCSLFSAAGIRLAVALIASHGIGAAAPGDVDPDFHLLPNGIRSAIVSVPDGGLLAMRGGAERFDRFGNAVTTFGPTGSATNARLAAIPGGGGVVVGTRSVDGTVKTGVHRFSGSGRWDESFFIAFGGSISAFAVQGDGKIIVGGSVLVNSVTTPVLRRFHSDGTEDTGFAASINGTCRSISFRSDGGILIGGSFTSVGGLSRINAALLNADGSTNPTFTANCAGSGVQWILERHDGRIIIGGGITGVNGTATGTVVAVDTSGAIDPSFAPSDTAITAPGPVALQADGKILLLGRNSSINGLMRLGMNGEVDSSISRGYSSTAVQFTLDGRGGVVVVGSFVQNSVSVPLNERLFNDGGSSVLEESAGGWIWNRSGSLADVGQVTFDHFDGETWSAPVSGLKAGGVWRYEGAVPARGILRARGRTVQSGNMGLVDEFVNIGGATPDVAVGLKNGEVVESGGAVAIPTVLPGYSRDFEFRISNKGDGILENLSTALSGAGSTAFSILNQPSARLAPGESASISVRFQGGDPGSSTVSLDIASNDGATPVHSITVTGTTGTTLSPTFFDAGEIFHVHTGSHFEGSALEFGALDLRFAPAPGTVLTVVRMGSTTTFTPFPDLTPGAVVTATYGGNTYSFLAGYRGGTNGTDLILTLIGDGTFVSSFGDVSLGTSLRTVRRGDGRLLVTSNASGQMALLRRDGEADAGFSAPSVYSQPVLVLQDGKILTGKVRLNRDGSIDSTFVPPAFLEKILAIRRDGKILAEERYSEYSSSRRLVRLLADGSVDPTFTSALPLMSQVYCAEELPDGRLLIGGNGTPLTRLAENGAIDSSFSSTIYAAGMVCQPDGKILVIAPQAGSAANRTNLKRLNADGSTDGTFSVVTDGYIGNVILQTDGRIVASGSFAKIQGVERKGVARLLPGGELDTAFRADVNGTVSSVVPDEDGTMVVSGAITGVSGTASGNLVRIRMGEVSSLVEGVGADGIRWLRSGNLPEFRSVSVEMLPEEGGAWTFLGQAQRIPGGWAFNGLADGNSATFRMSGDMGAGRIDGYLARAGATPSLVVKHQGLVVSPGTGTVDSGEIPRGLERTEKVIITNAGGRDLVDVEVSVTGAHAQDFVIAIAPDEGLSPGSESGLVVKFSPSAVGLRSADLEIRSNDPDMQIRTVALRMVGTSVLSPTFASPSDVPYTGPSFDPGGLMFGTLTLGFAPAKGSVLTVVNNISSDPISGVFLDLPHGGEIETIHAGQTYRFLASYEGGTGNDFVLRLIEPGVVKPEFSADVGGTVWAVNIQPDGKILIGGEFVTVGGVACRRIARLNVDGSLDRSFQAGVNHAIEGIAILPDGRILISGGFVEVNGTPQSGIARLLPDGRLDETFVGNAGPFVHRVLVLKSGKILIGGNISTVGGTAVKNLARLNEDGSLDPAFSCNVEGTGSSGSLGLVYAMVENDDGSVIFGGNFAKVNGSSSASLAKVNSVGQMTPDSFSVVGGVSSLLVQPDGKLLVGGSFLNLGGPRRFARVMPNGLSDPAFYYGFEANDTVTSVALQSDGKIIISGLFTQINGRPAGRIARLHANGILDDTFKGGASGPIYTAPIGRDGSIYAGGAFQRIDEFDIGRIAKLGSSTGANLFTVVSPDVLRWERTGSAAEMKGVEFLHSGDGSSWTKLGDGLRISGGWELAGATLPESGFLRASGRTLVSNRATAVLEETLLHGRTLTPIETWRQGRFGSPTNERSGANIEDPDGDGQKNLVEYAFGSDPNAGNPTFPLSWNAVADGYEVSFVKPSGVTDVIYGAEWSETMREDDWHPATDLGDGGTVGFKVVAEGLPRLFFRMRVSNP